jgi:hypothetical protein
MLLVLYYIPDPVLDLLLYPVPDLVLDLVLDLFPEDMAIKMMWSATLMKQK